MPFTRAQAQTLLNQAEMALFDDSRANALRSLDSRQLMQRIERTRKFRDKARDQKQRQRLASRANTGSKGGRSGDANARSQQKYELLSDILKRFEGQFRATTGKPIPRSAVRAVPRAAGSLNDTHKALHAAPGEAMKSRKPGKKAAKSATKPATTVRKAAAKASPAPAGKARPAKQPAAKAKAAAAKASASPKRPRKVPVEKPVTRITPEQALANTHALLEAKHQHDRQPASWTATEAHPDHGAPSPGYQTPAARSKVRSLHAGESHQQAILGSISTRDRRNQAKRDHR